MGHQEPRFGFALEYVKDIAAAKRFYVDVVGLKVELPGRFETSLGLI